MPKRVHETSTLTDATLGTPTTDGRMKVQAISAGLGSSGLYSADVLEQAAADTLIDTGTPLYFDHPSESERTDRPERSVRDIAAVFTGPATYDATTQALVGEVQVFGPYRELVTEMAPYIGLSIHGSATDVSEGEHPDGSGRRVPVIEGLATIDSVDLVTKAGRGGMFLLESVRPTKVNRRAVGHGVAEATVNDTREALQTALRDAYSDTNDADGSTWVYVRDFDDTTVWFEVEAYGDSNAESGLFGQTYTHTDGVVTLTGERTEVRVSTTYVPATRPDSTNPTTEESEEDTMGKIQVEESVHTDALAKAGRVDDAEKRATAAEEALAARDRHDRAGALVDEALAAEAARGVTFGPLEMRGLLADLPVKESDGTRVLDEEAFTKTVTEAVEAKVKAATTPGAGSGVTGFGAYAGQPGTGTHAAESTRPTRSPWGREIKGA